MPQTLFDKYKGTLTQLSVRTGASVPSLFASFLLLHEVTAIVPFIGVFYTSRALGIGETVVSSVVKSTEGNDGYAHAQVRQWMTEGEQMAERVGRRYGIFGFEKRSKPDHDSSVEDIPPAASSHIAGEIANVIVAYGVVKVRPRLLHLLDRRCLMSVPGSFTLKNRTFSVPQPPVLSLGV